MGNSSYRDPLDGPAPKLERRKSDLPETSGVDWWAHIPDIKRPAKNSSQSPVSSPSKTQKHISVSVGVREKVTKFASPQLPVSPPSKTQNIESSAITGNEEYIANQFLSLSDIDKLFTACSDSSGAKFQALSAPLIKRLSQFIDGEPINLEHVLFLLRKTLKITLP